MAILLLLPAVNRRGRRRRRRGAIAVEVSAEVGAGALEEDGAVGAGGGAGGRGRAGRRRRAAADVVEQLGLGGDGGGGPGAEGRRPEVAGVARVAVGRVALPAVDLERRRELLGRGDVAGRPGRGRRRSHVTHVDAHLPVSIANWKQQQLISDNHLICQHAQIMRT